MAQNREVTVPPKDESAVAGIPLPPPPDVTGVAPATLASGSLDSAVTMSGSFDDLCKGLVNGQERDTVVVSSISLRMTVRAADLATPGQLKISAKKNNTESNWVPLNVQ